MSTFQPVTAAELATAQAALSTALGFGYLIDEDDLASDSATKFPTQQSVKAYVDGLTTGLASAATLGYFIDEDDMAADSATEFPTQQSVKAYVDTEAIVDRVKATVTTQQVIASGTPENVVFDGTDDYDTNSMHDPASNNDRLIATKAGFYRITANVQWETGTTGLRAVRIIESNGPTTLAVVEQSADGDDAQSISVDVELAAAEYIVVQVEHTQAADLDVLVAGTTVSMTRIGA